MKSPVGRNMADSTNIKFFYKFLHSILYSAFRNTNNFHSPTLPFCHPRRKCVIYRCFQYHENIVSVRGSAFKLFDVTFEIIWNTVCQRAGVCIHTYTHTHNCALLYIYIYISVKWHCSTLNSIITAVIYISVSISLIEIIVAWILSLLYLISYFPDRYLVDHKLKTIWPWRVLKQ
jgi:hypothetical protein